MLFDLAPFPPSTNPSWTSRGVRFVHGTLPITGDTIEALGFSCCNLTDRWWAIFGVPPYPTRDPQPALITISGITFCPGKPSGLLTFSSSDPNAALSATWGPGPSGGINNRILVDYGNWTGTYNPGFGPNRTTSGVFRLTILADYNGSQAQIYLKQTYDSGPVLSGNGEGWLFSGGIVPSLLTIPNSRTCSPYSGDIGTAGQITVERTTNSLLRGFCLPDDDGRYPDGTYWEP